MSELTIEVQEREAQGKNANRRLRAAGQVPAVVYGGGIDPAPIQVSAKVVTDLLRKTAHDNPLFLLKQAGTDKSRHAMIRDMDKDAITGQMIHIDFFRVTMDEEINVTVQIELEGVPTGVKNEDGLLDFVTREVEVSALPNAIPGQIVIDVSGLHVGQHLEATDLEIPDGVTLLEEDDRVIVSVHAKREEEVEEEEEDLELAEPKVIGAEEADDDEEG